MRDIHCHILPGVDDGASNLDESLAMLAAAKAVGVDAITCTPHVRAPYFVETSYDDMWSAFALLKPYAQREGIQLQMGFEVNLNMLKNMNWDWVSLLAFDEDTSPVGHPDYTPSREFLLELPYLASPEAFEHEIARTINRLQSEGYTVIIAHPERYLAIQQNIDVAARLSAQGCLLQASSDYIMGGRLGQEEEPARELMAAGLYDCVGSDAHVVQHFEFFAQAYDEFLQSRAYHSA